ENERATWQLGFFKSNNTVQGWVVGDGQYNVTGRFTFLPWYEDNGRNMIHLGLGGSYAQPNNNPAPLFDRFQLPNGPFVPQTRITQGVVNGHNQAMIDPEFFMNIGPLSIQAEYLANHMTDVSGFQTQPQGTVLIKGPHRSYFSQGAYVQALYFLTGENRPYIK